MDYQTFIQKIRELTAEALGSAYRVELSAVPKNNGVMMDAIMIFREEENIAPTIYLRPCYESYRQHQSVRDSVKEIVDRYFCSLPKSWTGFTEFTDPDRVRDRIVFRLINYEKNRELLAGVPHRRFLNLALVYCVQLESDQIGTASVLVKNALLENWDMDEQELASLAGKNTQRLLPYCFLPLSELMRIVGSDLSETSCEEEWPETDEGEMPVYALTNRSCSYGAYWITVPELMKKICSRLQDDVYILPSSVHECMIVPVQLHEDADELASMVRTINREGVDEQEILADCVYRCSRENGALEICA